MVVVPGKMAWQNVTSMEEINRFVVLANSGRFNRDRTAREFGISRKTAYKHLERYAAEGLAGLQPRSHRPPQFPQRTDEAIETLILGGWSKGSRLKGGLPK